MIVYRIENSEHCGPYTGGCIYHRGISMGRCHMTERQPEANKEYPEMDSRDFCGFDSIQAVVNWFAGWFHKLHKDGFSLAIYDCPEELCLTGGKQVMFRMLESQRLEVVPLIVEGKVNPYLKGVK